MVGSTTEDGPRIDVVSWNIHGGRDVAGRYRLDGIAETLERLDADVIGLQEVDRGFGSRSAFDDQIALLAERLDMAYRFGANVVREPTSGSDGSLRRYGIATLCSPDLAIERSQHYLLPKIDYEDRTSERRGLLETEIDIGGRRLLIYNTHLGLTEDQRIRQVRMLLDLAARQSDSQVLLGDFNARPGSRPISRLTDRYEMAARRREDAPDPTFPADEPERRIDHVFVTPEVTVRDTTVLRTTASDHLPVKCVLEVANPASA